MSLGTRGSACVHALTVCGHRQSSLCLWEIYPFKSIIDTTAILRHFARLMSRNVPINHGQLCGNIRSEGCRANRARERDIISPLRPQRLALADDTAGNHKRMTFPGVVICRHGCNYFAEQMKIHVFPGENHPPM